MNETYNQKEAMDRLGLRSVNAFLQLERKYPNAFVIVTPRLTSHSGHNKHIHYDKATLDSFAMMRENFKQEKP